MKKISLLLICLFTISLCKADHWTRKADFPGGARVDAYGFAIGNKAYIGGGGVDDLWEYNPTLDTWTQKSNPPFSIGTPWPSGFTIGNYGYVFTDSNQLWEYAPLTDSWIRKTDLPGPVRSVASHFVIGNKAYIGGGIYPPYSCNSNFYCYDPATNSWTSIANCPDSFFQTTGFTANNKGYITGIWNQSGICIPMVLQYDPISNSWSQLANFPGIPRSDALSFNINNINYFGIGDSSGGGTFKDWWQYNANTDSWTQKASIPCTDGKDEDPSFVVNYKGYICFGADINQNAEVWEYTPDSLKEILGIITPLLQTNIYPNPATTELTITASEKITSVTIINLVGQVVASPRPSLTLPPAAPSLEKREGVREVLRIDVGDLPKGIYFIKINGSEVRKFVKE